MLLVGAALRELASAPFCDELLRGHAANCNLATARLWFFTFFDYDRIGLKFTPNH
jgi:hypothetical protein